MFSRMERVNEGGTLRQMLFAATVTRMMLVVQRFFLWRELSNACVLKDALSSLCTHECSLGVSHCWPLEHPESGGKPYGSHWVAIVE